MRIRTQLMLTLCAAVAVAFAVAGYVGYLYAKKAREITVRYDGETQASVLADVVTLAGERGHERIIRFYLRMLKRMPEIRDGYVIAHDGTILYHSNPRWVGMKASEYASRRVGVPLVFARTTWLGNEPGSVRVELDRRAFSPSLAQAQIILLPTAILLGALALGVGFGLAFLAAFWLTRPIQRLLAGAREIGSGHFAVEMPVGGGELGALSGQFNDMARRLRALDQLKDEWVSSVSHDLRNPMAAIKMYADFMLTEDPNSEKLLPEQREMIAVIGESAMRLNGFVSNILDAAKMKAERMEQHPQPVSVAAAFANAVSLFEMMASRKGIALSSAAVASLPPAYVDPQGFERVLFNLLSNALKFTPSGGSVTLSARSEGEKIAVRIADTGMGIPLELQGRLFERFYQADADGQKAKGIQGTGLGLYIVGQTVEEMGGTISISSAPRKGTCFTLLLPKAAAADPAGAR